MRSQRLGDSKTPEDASADAAARSGETCAARVTPGDRPIVAEDIFLACAGDGNVTLFQAAISPDAGTATMHFSASADSSSKLPISARQSELFPGTEEVGVTDVEAAPLSSFVSAADLNALALLKIDVQGFELAVLRGAGDVLAAFEHVYVEASFEALYEGQALADDVIALMVDAGFTEVGGYNMSIGPDGAPIQADFLFHKNPSPGA